MLKTGKHVFFVYYKGELFRHETIADIRTEEIPLFAKQSQNKQNNRNFDKNSSVFAPWKEDTQQVLELAFESDKTNWTVGQFVKDP